MSFKFSSLYLCSIQAPPPSELGIQSFDLLSFDLLNLKKTICHDRIALVDLLKDRPWSNSSRRSLKEIECELIVPVDLYKNSTGVIRSLSRLNQSYNHKK